MRRLSWPPVCERVCGPDGGTSGSTGKAIAALKPAHTTDVRPDGPHHFAPHGGAAVAAASSGNLAHTRVLPPRLAIGALSLAELPACAHALLRLVFLPRSPHAFLHYFEMGGEVSLIAEEAPLDALCDDGGGGDDACAGGEALRAALAPSLSRGWRAISVAAAQGAEAVGILSALTSRIRAPIMNVSSLDTNFILVRDADVAAVRAQLLPDYEIAQ